MFDDIIDSYGTMEEVHLFNQAVQRCVLGTSSLYVYYGYSNCLCMVAELKKNESQKI
jgi:hypothetical protein